MNTNVVHLIGTLDYQLLKDYRKDISALGDFSNLTVVITSEGGNAYVALAIIGELRVMMANGVEVTTCGIGEVSSGAADIFLAGGIRMATRETIFHFHRTNVSPGRSSAPELERHIAYLKIFDKFHTQATMGVLTGGECEQYSQGLDIYLTAEQLAERGVLTLC